MHALFREFFWNISDSHSDGTHSLQSIHCWDTFLQTWWRNKLGWTEWARFQQIFIYQNAFSSHAEVRSLTGLGSPPNQAVQLGLAGGLWIRKLLVARASQYLGFSTSERISARRRCRNPGSMAVPPIITTFSDRTLRVSMGHWWGTNTQWAKMGKLRTIDVTRL